MDKKKLEQLQDLLDYFVNEADGTWQEKRDEISSYLCDNAADSLLDEFVIWFGEEFSDE